MKITAIIENTSVQPEIGAEHGLSLYLEIGSRRVLFDAGQTDLLIKNAQALNIDLKQVDTVVLSHGHSDHGGGLPAFLEINRTAPVYASELCFEPYYNGSEKYIGLSKKLRCHSQFREVPEIRSLGDGMTLYPGRMVPTPRKVESYGLNVQVGGHLMPDHFLHEQYLLVEENGKRILFSGCSHRGILNIARHFKPDILVGGFHFKKLDVQKDQKLLEESARALLALPTKYYTCHCTGKEQYDFLKTIMGHRIEYLSAGTSISL